MKVISRACVRITVQIQIVCWTVHSSLLSSLSGYSFSIPLCFSLQITNIYEKQNKTKQRQSQDLQLVYWHFFPFPSFSILFSKLNVHGDIFPTSYFVLFCFPTNFIQGLYTYVFSFSCFVLLVVVHVKINRNVFSGIPNSKEKHILIFNLQS